MNILDNELLDKAAATTPKQCLFKPWIGIHYQQGFKGLKTLVLGESHYGESAYTDDLHTIDCAIDYGIKRTQSQRFYDGVHYACGVDEQDASSRENFWSHIAFNNYVQVFLTGTDKRPSADEWATGREPFKELIALLVPDLILVFGHDTWNKMPEMGKKLPDITGGNLKQPVETYSYDYGQHSSLTIKLSHPSSRGFDREHARAAVEAAQLLASTRKN